LGKNELEEMLHYGADTIFTATGEDEDFTEEDLERILRRGEEKQAQINQALDD
jgi:hypothetical protein